jgi:hypothetical protein
MAGEVYGSDLGVTDDLPEQETILLEEDNLAAALVRRITTSENALEEIGEEGYVSLDVRDLLVEGLTDATAADYEARVARACEDDERVSSVLATFMLGSDGLLSLTVEVVPVVGEAFTLTISISSVSATLIGIT